MQEEKSLNKTTGNVREESKSVGSCKTGLEDGKEQSSQLFWITKNKVKWHV